MPNEYGQYVVTNGPIRPMIFASLMQKNIVEFNLGQEKIVSNLEVETYGIMREDGSGHCWLFEGKIVNSFQLQVESLNFFWGFYRTNVHTGLVEPLKLQRPLFDIGQYSDKAIAIIDGPGLEDFFQSLYSGGSNHRCPVSVTRVWKKKETMRIVIDGIRKSVIPNSWDYIAYSPTTEERLTGVYNPHERNGWIAKTD